LTPVRGTKCSTVGLKASNGQVIASSEGYESKAAAINGIESVRKNAPDAPVVEG
jgi:uncharacterized protein YegP (UPF0339 family)